MQWGEDGGIDGVRLLKWASLKQRAEICHLRLTPAQRSDK